MYLDAPPAGAGTVSIDRPLGIAIGLCLAATLVFGLFPAPLVALGERGAEILAAGPTARAGADLGSDSIP